MKKQLNISKQAFWDVDFDALDAEKHKLFIVERIFDRGSFNDIKSVIRYYGKDSIKETIIRARSLSKKTLALASTLFDIPKENFACYSKMQSNLVHWDY